MLFYSRPLRRLIAVELKVGRFKAAYEGQMKLYLKWLNRYERREDEEAPIGLILCTEASREQVEMLEMHKDGIWSRSTGRRSRPRPNYKLASRPSIELLWSVLRGVSWSHRPKRTPELERAVEHCGRSSILAWR